MHPHVQAHHGIDGYWRFRDDILILGSDKSQAREFFWKLRELAGFFRVQCESWSSNEIQFLEVIVRKDVDNNRYVTIPKYRDSSISKPLDPSSAHPPHVHRSWPQALARRMMDLTNTAQGRDDAMCMLERRFIDNFADPHCLHPCKTRFNHGSQTTGRPSWITFGFHPAFRRCIQRGVQKCMQGPFSGLYRRCFGDVPNIRVAW